MLPRKEKIITGFKALSIILITLMLVDFYQAINKEELTNLKKISETQTKINQIYTPKINSFCDTDPNLVIEMSKNSFMYYSFAIILGAFINAKKIMKIGVI